MKALGRIKNLFEKPSRNKQEDIMQTFYTSQEYARYMVDQVAQQIAEMERSRLNYNTGKK